MSEPAFQPEHIFRVLSEHGVHYVLIGGYAALLHGSPYATFDVDVVPAEDRANLDALSRALKHMHAKVWTQGSPEGLPFDHSAETLSMGRIWNLITDHGRLDITFEPSGTSGYDDLRRDVLSLTVLGQPVDVASLADVVRSKQAAGRPKDQLVLPVLREILGKGPPEERT